MIDGIYLDFAATTPVDGEALNAALPYFSDCFYNPSSMHALGQKSAAAVSVAREQCATAINAAPNEIYFTSGGTEAINWVFRAIAEHCERIAVSAIEHDAVLACAEHASALGVAVDYVQPSRGGIVTPEALEKAIKPNTGLVCVMTVNNIVGSVQPIKRLAEIAHEHGALFFTDAVQAVNALDIDVKTLNVDLLAVSGHKLYAPKGSGFLYVKSGVSLSPEMLGGEQERGKRAGTQDVPAIVALGYAMQKANAEREKNNAHVKKVAAAFLDGLNCGNIIECESKIADIITVAFPPINGGRLAVALSCAGVCCSVGSACSAGSATPPKTLVSMGVERPDCAVRFSFGKTLGVEDAVAAARIVNKTVKTLLKNA